MPSRETVPGLCGTPMPGSETGPLEATFGAEGSVFIV
jgi:hypothetical protein